MAYLDNEIAAVGVITNCASLNAALSRVTTEVNDLQSKITAQIAALAPLLTAPTDLPGLVTWAGHMVTLYVLPHTNLLTQEAALTSKLAEYTTAVTNRLHELGC